MRELIERTARFLIASKYAIALTGAGISTESGIPDFRGPQGIWTKNPEAEKRAYLSYQKFLREPKRYWEERLKPQRSRGFWREIDMQRPNPGHYALAELEKRGILKCLLTQNVDGLHEKAGSQNLVEYHGSIFKLRCTACGSRFNRDTIDLEKIKSEGKLPPRCQCSGIIKGDTVSFGEPIPPDVYQKSIKEAEKCDLMLICGTSAVVYPFAGLPRTARQRGEAVKIIEINLEPTPLTHKISDYLIQGKTGEILPKIVEETRKLKSK